MLLGRYRYSYVGFHFAPVSAFHLAGSLRGRTAQSPSQALGLFKLSEFRLQGLLQLQNKDAMISVSYSQTRSLHSTRAQEIRQNPQFQVGPEAGDRSQQRGRWNLDGFRV